MMIKIGLRCGVGGIKTEENLESKIEGRWQVLWYEHNITYNIIIEI